MSKFTLTQSFRKLACCSAFTLLSFTASQAQTYVSGGIFSNTTWTLAGSPYIITDTVVIFQNVTLTIQPGVIVKFDTGTLIDERGTLIANGTPADSIIFTSNSNSPYAGIYQGINVSSDTVYFKYCRFSNANNAINITEGLYPGSVVTHCLFESNLSGLTEWEFPVDTCIFKYDSIGMNNSAADLTMGCTFIKNGTGIESSHGPVMNCTFSNNTYGVRDVTNPILYCYFDSNYTAANYAMSVSYCSLKYNNIAIDDADTIIFNDISDNSIGIKSYYPHLISCNTLCGNTVYNMVAESPINESVSNNYWCLSDSTQIQTTIYDAYQDISLGFIFFTPFDTTACSHICNLSLQAAASQTVVCAGDTTTLQVTVTDANPIYTAVWNPGNHTGLSYTANPLANTTYTVVVTDSTGCKDSAFVTIDTSCIISHNCNLFVAATGYPAQVCLGDSATLYASITDSNAIQSIIWNPGNYNGNICHVIPYTNTVYTVTVTDIFGCKDSSYVYIDTMLCSPCSNLSPPPICYVTTDTSSTFNSIFWQKAGMDTLATDSVVIYRQNILNTFVRIGAVSIHAPTVFNDYTARPLVEPSFYELGIHDTCGLDTILSNFSETVFLQSSVGVGPNEVNLNWNFYQGNPVIYYRILRDDSGRSNWHAIDSIQGSINSYTDRNAPVNPDLRYLITTDWNVACSPFMLLAPHKDNAHYAFDGEVAYSNMTFVFPHNTTISATNFINIYPNPFNNTLFLSFSQPFSGSVIITNVLGQVVYNNSNFTSNGNTGQINLSTLENGVYIITLQSGDVLVKKKIIKM